MKADLVQSGQRRRNIMSHVSNNFLGERCLIFDESGNMGSRGRYFVISCIDTFHYKSLHNIMRKKLGDAQKIFPDLALLHTNEIKAKDAYPCVKYHILESIAKKDISISYIVADLKHVKPILLKEKNIFYNYLMKLLIDRLVTSKDNGTKLNIICDNHTTKIASGNSFEEYIKLHLIYEKGYDLQLNVVYMDSNDRGAYSVQAADYIANALYGLYEYNGDIYYNQFKSSIRRALHFPYKLFGT